MKTQAIQCANVQFNDKGLPWSPDYGDIYHPETGAWAQARHVFLAGNGLPDRWQLGHNNPAHDPPSRPFTILETGFGLGHNFLATWQAWRETPEPKRALDFISLEKHPLTITDLQKVHEQSPLPALSAELCAQWPALTPNLHTLMLDGGRVRLLLGLGDALDWLPELVARVDAFYLDGFAPSKNPQLWQPKVYKALARLAHTEATVATWSAARAVREGLSAAGFEVRVAPGQGGKRDITLARYAPRFVPRVSPRQAFRTAPVVSTKQTQQAIIVGAGLAGCATATALSRQGWHCHIIDQHDGPAQATSGNLAGLFHGVVHGHDGTHARFNRAAALRTQQVIRGITTEGPLGDRMRGHVSGLLRLQTHGTPADRMQHMLDQLGLPASYVQALDAAQASECCGWPLTHPAWFYPGGGWARPADLCQHWLSQSQHTFSGRCHVQRIARVEGQWQVMGAQGRLIAAAPVLVLANAEQALTLLGQPDWGVHTVRGQISHAPCPSPQAPWPHRPLAGAGYLIPNVDGQMVFGATSQIGDPDTAVREADHALNLAQLTRLLGQAVNPALARAGHWQGRTGWRCVAPDRLPMVGAVPDMNTWQMASRPIDQVHQVPRQAGLYVCMALGSRGITWAALIGELVASLITGAAMPVESSLLDAIDPARFVVRTAKQPSSKAGS